MKENVWVKVDHLQKTATKYINDGSPITGNGAHMTLEYFNKLQANMPDVSTYKVIEK
jgi:hypothetical protein